jgi:hypothetical protein
LSALARFEITISGHGLLQLRASVETCIPALAEGKVNVSEARRLAYLEASESHLLLPVEADGAGSDIGEAWEKT